MEKALTTTENIPPAETDETRQFVLDLLEEVKTEIEDKGLTEVAQDTLEAIVYHTALVKSEERRQEYSKLTRAVQAQIVVRVTRAQAWLAMLTAENSYKGYGGLDEFLCSTPINDQTRSALKALGELLLPYMDKRTFDIEPYLTQALYPKFVEAIPALRGHVEEIEVKNEDGTTSWVLKDEIGDRKRTTKRRVAQGNERLKEVTEILTNVQALPDRHAVRKKYQKRRREPAGDAGWIHPDGTHICIVVANDEEDLKRINARLNGYVRWHLVAEGKRKGHAVKILLEV